MDIFTKYLRTVKGIINVTETAGEVITDLGFTANGVPVSTIKMGTLVVFDTVQENGVLTFKAAATGDTPVGYIASQVKFDFNRGKYMTDSIKLFGYIFEAAAKTTIANGAAVGFVIPAAGDATDKEYEVPMVAAATGGPMKLISSTAGSKAGEFLADIYVPVLNTGAIA